MKPKLLLPHKFKRLGYILAIPAFVLTMAVLYFDFGFHFLQYTAPGSKSTFDNGILFFNMPSHNFTVEAGSVLFMAGLLLVAFSQEKYEDERISKMRLESLLWAVLINTICIMFSILLFYGSLFLSVMLYNIITPLVLFIVRFNLLMYFDGRRLQREVAL